MEERIDFALEPGVILFAVLFFVLVNVLLAAVLYPYFRSGSSSNHQAADQNVGEDELLEPDTTSEEELEERVDEFLEDIEKEHAT